MANKTGPLPSTPPGPQPNQVKWMQPPKATPNCPPGLEYLITVDQLLVHQMIDLAEILIGFEGNNKYEIKNSLGQRVYSAAEDTHCCTRICLGKKRPFEMHLMDNSGNEVIRLHSPLRCDTCWCPCFLKKVEVQAPPGNVIGYVCQSWSLWKPAFKIKNANEETMLTIKGPCCTCTLCCGDVEFMVNSSDGDSPVGKISKQWSGLLKEMYTDSDNFGITFPIDLDVNVKATLLGATFLIDFMYFEKSGGMCDSCCC